MGLQERRGVVGIQDSNTLGKDILVDLVQGVEIEGRHLGQRDLRMRGCCRVELHESSHLHTSQCERTVRAAGSVVGDAVG
jgi:hypothetical protein